MPQLLARARQPRLQLAQALGDALDVGDELVAVTLDPRYPQECDIEVPLWLWGLPDSAAVGVANLMGGDTFTMAGKMQHIRLDPAVMPFLIWRIRPVSGAA